MQNAINFCIVCMLALVWIHWAQHPQLASFAHLVVRLPGHVSHPQAHPRGLHRASVGWCPSQDPRSFFLMNVFPPPPPQEVTQKILEAVANIAGSSLEQTSWLSRSLEVKAQPQISLEESDAEEDLGGRCRRVRK